MYRVAALRHWRYGVPVCAMVYALSFVMMAILPAPGGLIVGRLVEGLAIGVRVPLLFRDAMAAEPAARNYMLVAMGSFYGIGYVAGPFVADVSLAVLSRGQALVGFGVLTLAVSVALEAARPGSMGLEPDESTVTPTTHRFTLLFVAKFFYGFLLVSITAADRPHLFADRISVVALGLAVVFTLGQTLAARLAAYWRVETMAPWFALGLGVACVLYALQPGSTTLIAAAFVQAGLFFIGQRVVGTKPADSKTFALFSALSDPGAVLGAVAGRLGTKGAFVVALAALVPVAFGATRRVGATD
jgi:MFS family permease